MSHAFGKLPMVETIQEEELVSHSAIRCEIQRIASDAIGEIEYYERQIFESMEYDGPGPWPNLPSEDLLIDALMAALSAILEACDGKIEPRPSPEPYDPFEEFQK